MKNNPTVSPKQSAPVERNSHATAAGAEGKRGVCPSVYEDGRLIGFDFDGTPFAGDDAE